MIHVPDHYVWVRNTNFNIDEQPILGDPQEFTGTHVVVHLHIEPEHPAYQDYIADFGDDDGMPEPEFVVYALVEDVTYLNDTRPFAELATTI